MVCFSDDGQYIIFIESLRDWEVLSSVKPAPWDRTIRPLAFNDDSIIRHYNYGGNHKDPLRHLCGGAIEWVYTIFMLFFICIRYIIVK